MDISARPQRWGDFGNKYPPRERGCGRRRRSVTGRAAAYEKVLKDAQDVVIREMTDEATALGANAVSVLTLITRPLAKKAACSWSQPAARRYSRSIVRQGGRLVTLLEAVEWAWRGDANSP